MNTQNNNTTENNKYEQSSNMQYYGPSPYNFNPMSSQIYGSYTYNLTPIQSPQNYINDNYDDECECIPGGGF